MDGTRPGRNVGLSESVENAASWVATTWTADAEVGRVAQMLRQFVGFCEQGFGIDSLPDVTPVVAAQFVDAVDAGGADPSLSLRHLRRLAVRLLYRAARSDGLHVGDPTLDLVLPPRSALATRPLTDDEVVLARGAAQWSLSDTRRGAAWALSEATCRTSELPLVTIGDVDLDQSRVWIRGGSRTARRWGLLDEWGSYQVARRIAAVGGDPALPLLYTGTDPIKAGQISTCTAVQDVLTRAGLGDEPDVRAASVAAWAGRRILAETGRIEVVAHRMGLRSLDRVARIIGWDWAEETCT